MHKKIVLLLNLFFSLVAPVYAASHDELGSNAYCMGTLVAYVKPAQSFFPQLYAVANNLDTYHADTKPNGVIKPRFKDYPLYNCYPALEKQLPSIALGSLPTPVQEARAIAQTLNVGWLGIKRDDQTGASGLYGGNKVRKLEFLLADALVHGAQEVMTFGCIGSNHVVATAAYAQQCGLNSIAMLTPQPLSHGVQRNLLLMNQYDAQMQLYQNVQERAQGAVTTAIAHALQHQHFPYVIPTGGSCPLGAVGYVNAAFELKEQIEQGLLPEPDYIYVTCGTKGTTAGLLLGLKAAGLQSLLIPVCIQNEDPATCPELILTLARATNELLHKADPSFPLITLSEQDLPIIYDCRGERYGLFTPEGNAAKDLLQSHEGITLDGTYTAKGFSGLVRDAQQGKLHDKKVLFWNTFCADCEPVDTDYIQLHKVFHTYFESDVQELDM